VFCTKGGEALTSTTKNFNVLSDLPMNWWDAASMGPVGPDANTANHLPFVLGSGFPVAESVPLMRTMAGSEVVYPKSGWVNSHNSLGSFGSVTSRAKTEERPCSVNPETFMGALTQLLQESPAPLLAPPSPMPPMSRVPQLEALLLQSQ